MTSNDEYVLQILLENHKIDPDTADSASLEGAKEGISAVSYLIKTGILTENDVLGVLAATFNMEFYDISGLALGDDIRDLLPGDLARKVRVVPLWETNGVLTVAMADPMSFETLDSLRSILNKDVEGVVAPPQQIIQALGTLYPDSDRVEVSDTAVAAEMLSDGRLSEDTAVVCRRNAGEMFRLHLVHENIEDMEGNMTEFELLRLRR